MRWEKLRMRFRMLLGRGRAAEWLDAELQFHLEQQIAENLAAGMSAEEARYAAMRSFGNTTLVREQARETWNWAGLESVLRDVRYAARALARAPGFSLIAIAVMAMGIGATVTLFTIVHAVLMKPLPFPDQDRLVMIYEADSTSHAGNHPVAGGTFLSWQQRNYSFGQMGVTTQGMAYNLSSPGGQLPERVQAEAVSWQTLAVLGLHAVPGRLFLASDDGYAAPKTAVITWGFWQRRFGGSQAAIGSTLLLDAAPFTVIGVLPRWFTWPDAKVQLLTDIMPQIPEQVMESHDSHNFHVIGRLKPGISLARAQADLSTISAQERKRFPDGPVHDAANVHPLLQDEVREVKTPLYALLGATGCLLLIACLNVANLLVARGAARRREMAIRAALGGGRGRRMRAQVTESILLSAAGGATGTALAAGALHWLLSVRTDLPRAGAVHLDGAALLFAVGVAALCGITAGIAPALMDDDRQVLQTLQEASRSHSGGRARVRVRRALLTVEVGLTVVLLIGAGLLLRSYQQLRSVRLGCATHNVLTMGLTLPDAQYKTEEQKSAFVRELSARVHGLPGVEGVAMTTMLPGAGDGEDDAIVIHEDPPLKKGAYLDAMIRWVNPEYFEAMHIPLLRGRAFAQNEGPGDATYAIVSESFVKQFFAGRDPLGKHIDDANNGPLGAKTEASNQIIGVVGNTLATVYSTEPAPTIYYPLYGGLRGDISLAVRTAYDPLQLARPVQQVIAGLDRNLPVADVLTMEQIIGQSMLDSSFDATLLALFAGVSLALAAVGLFGVLSFIAAQRTTEMGIRMALGAQREAVLGLMLRDGMAPALVGLALGLAASAGTARLVRSMLYQTHPFDPGVFLLVAVLLLAVAALACAVPAWRASRLDPMQALRME
jgi:predicted permease